MAIRFGQLRTVLPTSENTFIQGLQIAAHCKSVDISPVYVYSAKQQTCRSLLLMGQTDGRTPDRYIDLVLLSSHSRIMPTASFKVRGQRYEKCTAHCSAACAGRMAAVRLIRNRLREISR